MSSKLLKLNEKSVQRNFLSSLKWSYASSRCLINRQHISTNTIDAAEPLSTSVTYCIIAFRIYCITRPFMTFPLINILILYLCYLSFVVFCTLLSKVIFWFDAVLPSKSSCDYINAHVLLLLHCKLLRQDRHALWNAWSIDSLFAADFCNSTMTDISSNSLLDSVV